MINFLNQPKLLECIVERGLDCKWPCFKIHDPFIVDTPIPSGCESDPGAFAIYEAYKKSGFQTQYLISIPSGIAAGAGFVRLPTGEFLTESTFRVDYLFGKYGSHISRALYRRHKMHLVGDYYYLQNLFTSNYGHWIVDELPRLLSALPYLPESTKFILSDPIAPYKIHSLEALGINRDRILAIPGIYEIHCERLWFATHLGHTDWATTSPSVLLKVRQNLINTYLNPAVDAPEKIYVSRAKITKNRRLINESELIPIIEKFGFDIVYPEILSLADQINLFSKAKVILGTHGAGLINAMFAPIPCKVLEMKDSKLSSHLAQWYWKFVSILGHNYSTLVGPYHSKPLETLSGSTNCSLFSIDKKSLEHFLESKLASEYSKDYWRST